MQNNNEASNNLLQEIGFHDFIGQSPKLREVLSKIPLIAETEATVLITGETGVGKDLCARAIHYLSERADKPFVAVNCGTLPATLIENELFGHKRGAFTDARETRAGLLANANGGTLFLDEIEMLDLKGQSTLLRLLEDNTYRPLGQYNEIKSNIRFIAATNSNLHELSKMKAFRMDLIYRFTIPLDMPPLRERRSDIPLLAIFFAQRYASKNKWGFKGLCSDALQRLINYEWPGNIRELKNTIENAVVLERVEYLELKDFNCQQPYENSKENLSYKEAKQKFEEEYLSALLLRCSGNVTMAAKIAKKERGDFYRLLRKHKIDRDTWKSL